MKLKKIITMGLAAIMAVSAMSISAFAAKDDPELFSEDTVTVFTYNENTETYDISYETAPAMIEKLNKNADSIQAAGFDFDQTINTTFQYLRDINNINTVTNKYFTTGSTDTTFVINLSSYPKNNKYYFKIYDVTNNNQDTTPGNYTNYQLVTPTCVFNNNPSNHKMSVQLRTQANSAHITGELYSY